MALDAVADGCGSPGPPRTVALSLSPQAAASNMTSTTVRPRIRFTIDAIYPFETFSSHDLNCNSPHALLYITGTVDQVDE
jgi:hypothetical protein